MSVCCAQYLGVIMFAIVMAIILNSLGPSAEPLIRVIEIANDVIMAMVRPHSQPRKFVKCGLLHACVDKCKWSLLTAATFWTNSDPPL